MLYVPTLHQVSIPCLDTPTPPISRPCRPALPSSPRRATSSKATPPAAEKVEAFLTSALDATGKDATAVASALVQCALGVRPSVRREKVLVSSGCNSHPATGSLQPVAIGAAVEPFVPPSAAPSRSVKFRGQHT